MPSTRTETARHPLREILEKLRRLNKRLTPQRLSILGAVVTTLRLGAAVTTPRLGTVPPTLRRGAIASLLCMGAAACGGDSSSTSPEAPGLAVADSAVAEWVRSERIPGAVLLVARGGEVLIEEAYGYAQLFGYGSGQYDDPAGLRRLDPPVSMTVGTAFDLASVTKVVATTLAVMLLVDRGEIELSDPVDTYLPDFTGDGREDVTVRHLLTHTAGLRPWVPTYYHASEADEAYAYVRDLPLVGEPGTERRYSDLGFMLLGRIVEAVSGQPLDRFVEDVLYGPLGLTRTAFRRRGDVEPPGGGLAEEETIVRRDPPMEAAPGAGRGVSGASRPIREVAATSHGNPFERRMVHDPDFGYLIGEDPDAWDGWRQRTLVGEVNDGNAYHAFGGVAGHAGLFSTAAELATLVRLVVEGGSVDGVTLFRRGTVDLFLEPVVEGQALGWQLPDHAPEGAFGHTGFTGTFVLAHPGEELVIVLLTNRQNVGVDEETQYPDVGPLQREITRAILAPVENAGT